MNNKGLTFFFLAAVVLAGLLSPLASSFPDGLERVAEDYQFLSKAREVVGAPFPDYLFPGIPHEGVATSLAGIAGTLITFGALYALGKLLRRRGNA